ncbi:unnamed protein product, partial [Closterium sp. Naga37s-1]
MKHIKIKPARIVSVDVPGGKALVGEVISGPDAAAIDVSVLGWAAAVPQSLICLFPPPPHEAPLLAATASSAPVPPRSCISLGSYSSAEEAARAYDMAARMLRCDAAGSLNFPDSRQDVPLPPATAELLVRMHQEVAEDAAKVLP